MSDQTVIEGSEEQMTLLRTQKPYLINALRRWAVDMGAKPHLLVDATWPGTAGVPDYLIKENLVLNVASAAVNGFQCDKDGVSAGMTFMGKQCQLYFPVGAIKAIYAPDLMSLGMSFASFGEVKPTETPEAVPVQATTKPRPSFMKVVK